MPTGWSAPAATSATAAGAPRLTSSLVRDERLQQRLRQLHLGMLGGAAALENRLALEEHLWQALACLLSLGSSLRLEEGDREGFGQRDWTRLRDWLESRLEYPPNLEELAAFCGPEPGRCCGASAVTAACRPTSG